MSMNTQALVIDVNVFLNAMTADHVKQGESLDFLRRVLVDQDALAVRKFGIGMARPWPMPLGGHLRSGYVVRGRSLAELAAHAGIDASGLAEQVARFNAAAAQGTDPGFHRGETALEKRGGDSECWPNPCLRPLDRAPFYAVKILPGDFSTLAGLRCDGNARVLDVRNEPIPGLYAAGNDLSTMGGGHSSAAGFTLGPAVTFGFIAGRHMSAAAKTNPL